MRLVLGSNVDYMNNDTVRVLDTDTGEINEIAKYKVVGCDNLYNGTVTSLSGMVVCHYLDFAVGGNAVYLKGYVYPMFNTGMPVYFKDINDRVLTLVSGAHTFIFGKGRITTSGDMVCGQGMLMDKYTYLLRNGLIY